MNINNRTEPSLELKISDWELDFYSRPIIESNGKKRWELIICATRSYKTKDIFFGIKNAPPMKLIQYGLQRHLMKQ